MNIEFAIGAVFSTVDMPLAPVSLRLERQFRHAHEVVGRSHPPSCQLRFVGSPITRFPKPTHRFHPTEDLFDFLSYLLTGAVTAMTRGATIDGRAALAFDVGCHMGNDL